MRTKRSIKKERYRKCRHFTRVQCSQTHTRTHIRSNRALSVPSKFYLQMLKGNVNLSTPLRQRMIKYQHHNRPQLLPLNLKQYTKDHVKKVHNEGGKWKHFMLLVKKLNKSSWTYMYHIRIRMIKTIDKFKRMCTLQHQHEKSYLQMQCYCFCRISLIFFAISTRFFFID